MAQKGLTKRALLKALTSLPAGSVLGGNRVALEALIPAGEMPSPELGEVLHQIHKAAHAYYRSETGRLHETAAMPESSYTSHLGHLKTFAESLMRIANQSPEHIAEAMEYWKLHEMRDQTAHMQRDRETVEGIRQQMEGTSGAHRHQMLQRIKAHESDLEISARAIDRLQKASPAELIAQWKEEMSYWAPGDTNAADILEDPKKLPGMLKEMDRLADAMKIRSIPDTEYKRFTQALSDPSMPPKERLESVLRHSKRIAVKPVHLEWMEHAFYIVGDSDTLPLVQGLMEQMIAAPNNAYGWAHMQANVRNDVLIVRPVATAHRPDVEQPMHDLENWSKRGHMPLAKERDAIGLG